MEFEAIQPTRTYREEERSLRVGGSETVLVEQIPYTVYNVEKITARVTNSPTLAVGNLGLEALSDPGQLGALLQVTQPPTAYDFLNPTFFSPECATQHLGWGSYWRGWANNPARTAEDPTDYTHTLLPHHNHLPRNDQNSCEFPRLHHIPDGDGPEDGPGDSDGLQRANGPQLRPVEIPAVPPAGSDTPPSCKSCSSLPTSPQPPSHLADLPTSAADVSAHADGDGDVDGDQLGDKPDPAHPWWEGNHYRDCGACYPGEIDQEIKTELVILPPGGHLHHPLHPVRPGGRVPKSLPGEKPQKAAAAAGHSRAEKSLNKKPESKF